MTFDLRIWSLEILSCSRLLHFARLVHVRKCKERWVDWTASDSIDTKCYNLINLHYCFSCFRNRKLIFEGSRIFHCNSSALLSLSHFVPSVDSSLIIACTSDAAVLPCESEGERTKANAQFSIWSSSPDCLTARCPHLGGCPSIYQCLSTVYACTCKQALAIAWMFLQIMIHCTTPTHLISNHRRGLPYSRGYCLSICIQVVLSWVVRRVGVKQSCGRTASRCCW